MGRKSEVSDAEEGIGTTPAKPSGRPDYDELIKRISVIAQPLASRKLTKRLYRTVKKAAKHKLVRRGVKDVSKALKKGEKGYYVDLDTVYTRWFVVIAGDVSPIDVITHVPVLCEDKDITYAYVPSRSDLGLAGQTKRGTSVVLVKRHEDYGDTYDSCIDEMKSLPVPL